MKLPPHAHGSTFWALQIPGWCLLIYLIWAQGVSAFSYELGVAMGTQESAEIITEVGTAFFYGFALADLLIYIPILLVGLVGNFFGTQWSKLVMAAALGITVYWPIVCLAAAVDARNAAGWQLTNEAQYWIFLPLISAWGAWGLIAVVRKFRPEVANSGD